MSRKRKDSSTPTIRTRIADWILSSDRRYSSKIKPETSDGIRNAITDPVAWFKGEFDLDGHV